VGNLSVGGTGKTPAVIALVRELMARGLRCAVVLRGYGGSSPGPMPVQADSAVERVGDEALLLASALGCPVAIGRDRPAAVALLLAAQEVDIIVSDDGLQHYALARDFEIVVLDSELRFGNGHLLPVGPLRESPRRLEAVDWVLERGGDDPRSAYRYEPVALDNLATGERRRLLAHGLPRQVHAVAGIGAPEKFFATLRELGFDPLQHPFPDHHAFAASDFAAFDDAPVIMTEKDAVKCRAFARESHWALVIEAQLPEGLSDSVAALVAPEASRHSPEAGGARRARSRSGQTSSHDSSHDTSDNRNRRAP
jgi:tetraacyldisaccharide 4'-kinase